MGPGAHGAGGVPQRERRASMRPSDTMTISSTTQKSTIVIIGKTQSPA
jgi:hypothetical protein